MTRPKPQPSAGSYESYLSALWPDYGDDDSRQYDLDKAYTEITSSRRLDLTLPGPREWEPWPAATVRPLVRVICEPDLHGRRYPSPRLAEIWQTTLGLLFVARLIGAFDDPPPAHADPLAPPVPVLPRALRNRAGAPPRFATFEPIPVTVVRVLLERPPLPPLWTKCADHGSAIVDPARLSVAFEHSRRRKADTLDPTTDKGRVGGLDDGMARTRPFACHMPVLNAVGDSA